ncbi:MAG: thioredoxin family protein [Syntrophaceae bacterium]|nr:thioredoxin family protein [Syntrophaceae bacterium]
MTSDIVQVSIGDRSIGIVGLKKVMIDLAATAAGKTDEECRELLYRGIADQNYIPPKMAEGYKDALLRAFKVFTGEAAEQAPAGGVRIQVLGPGCFNCDKIEKDVREVLAELKIPGDLSHVTDPVEIAKFGVLGVPALVINGRIVCVGTVPDRNRIKQWLMDLKASQECKEGT